MQTRSARIASSSGKDGTAASRTRLCWLLVCFTGSGLSGLIYEVAWVRSLELVFGTTTFAVATVLAAFMGGLACGSLFMGRWMPRFQTVHPLKLYAGLEVMIAVVALLVPLLLHALVPVYQAVWKNTHASFVMFSLVRFALSAVVLLIPTFLMGATLPVLSGFVNQDPELGERRIGLLYTCNTTGAVLGCAAAGLVLFPALGLALTQWIAVGFNLAAAAGGWILSRQVPAPSTTTLTAASAFGDPVVSSPAPGTETDRAPNAGGRIAVWLVTAYAVSGFVAMLYEVAWSRVLVLVLGASTYACTIMLATFLLGLAAGAWLATRWIGRSAHPLLHAGFCQIAIALFTYVSMRWVDDMPFFYLKIYETFMPTPRALLSVQFLLAASLMILPTLGLGAMFPITIHGLNPSGTQTGRVVGWAYALNTLGAIVGSVLAGFWLVPHLGSQTTLLTGIALNAAMAAALFLLVREGPMARFRGLISVAVVLLFVTLSLATSRWDPAVMSSGVFRYVRDYLGLNREAFRERARKVSGEVLLFDEGLTCTVTVFRNPECLSLLVNGKPDASTPSGLSNPFDTNAPPLLLDLPTQILLGQIPMLLAPRRDEALVIGLGSGLTVGSVLTHPVRKVECIELENAVVRGSRFFEDFNGRPLSDPRTELVVNDARNHLLVTDRRYDVIISEPSNPWIPGAANLFTREFFEISRARLQPDGVFCQWIQIYELQPEHFQTILRTFTSVFPEVHLFRVNHDAILVGSAQAHPIDTQLLESRLTPAVRKDLERIRVRTVPDLLARYWVGGAELKAGLDQAVLNTDDNMRIEFAAPLQILSGSSGKDGSPGGIAALYAGRTSGAIPHVKLTDPAHAAEFWADVGQAALRERLPETLIYTAHSLRLRPNAAAAAAQGVAMLWQGQADAARRFLEPVEPQFPDAWEPQRALTLVCAQQREWAEARRHAQRWVQGAPDDHAGWLHLGRSLFYLNEDKASLAALQQIPGSARAVEELKDLPFYLGALHARNGRPAEAAECFREFLRRDPAHLEARVLLADALYRAGRSGDAAVQWQKVAQVHRSKAAELQRAGTTDWQEGRREEAIEKLKQARRLDPASADITLLLAHVQTLSGHLDDATETLARYLEAFPDQATAVGYLGQLRAGQHRPEEAHLLGARYRALTGTAWEDLRD